MARIVDKDNPICAKYFCEICGIYVECYPDDSEYSDGLHYYELED